MSKTPCRAWIVRLSIGILALLLVLPEAVSAKTQAHVIPGGGISGHHIKIIYRGLRMTDDYMQKTFGLEFLRPIEIHATTRASREDEAIRSGRIAGQSNDGRVLVYVAENSGDGNVLYTTAHEMVHQYQVAAVGTMAILGKNMWFIEGMADVLAARIIAPIAPGLDKTFRRNARRAAKKGPRLFAITTPDGWQQAFQKEEEPYPRADAAVLYLTDHYPLPKLFDCLAELRQATAEEALRRVYGITAEELERAIAK